MLIQVLHHDDVCVLRLRGRFATGAELNYLEARREEVLNLSVSKMLVDLREVISIGSTGLGFIVSVFKSVVRRPYGRCVLVCTNPRVRNVFNITRLSDVIPMTDDVESALMILRGSYPELQNRFEARSDSAAF